MVKEQRVRERPRISGPKLGEYLDAGPGRRERLLLDQKFPPTFKVARYADAENAIRASLVSGVGVVARLRDFADELSERTTTTEWTTVGKDCCVTAIREFARVVPNLPTAGSTFRVPDGRLMLNIEGVTVSLHPIALSQRSVRGVVRRGAILAVFQKGEPMGEMAGRAAVELLRRGLTQTGVPEIYPGDCVVVDVFRRRIFTATAQNRRVFANITSACREIAVRWPTLSLARAA